MNKELLVVGAVRTPFGRFGGGLRDIDCIDLSAMVIEEVLKRGSIEPGAVEEVFWGVGDTAACQDVYTPVIARQALLKAGLPPDTPSCSFDKACVSGISAIQFASRAVKAGEVSLALAGGVTTFSQMPLVLRNMRWNGHRLGSVELEDPLYALGYKDFNPVAVDAGEVAVEHGVTREEQDRWALRSHHRYGDAHKAGKFNHEIMPLVLEKRVSGQVEKFTLAIDEQYRAGITIEALQKLGLIYGSPTVTAGNAPGLNDGAAAMVVAAPDRARELGLKPLAKIMAVVSTAMVPRMLAAGPAKAIRMALDQAGLKLEEMKLLEINEAFAAVTLVSSKILAGGDASLWEQIKERLNVNGGAIAIGHANTCSGTRIVMTLIEELRRRGGGYGVAAICGGLAQADACVVKVE